LRSDQAETYVLFATTGRAGRTGGLPAMRVLRRALVLDADGYRTPVFSADGRHFAIRGNAYDNSLEVFGFPSLDRVLSTTLGDPYPGYPASERWREQYRSWSRRNIAFGTKPGVLWVGTPAGILAEIDLGHQQAAEHDLLAGSRVTALCATATGELALATAQGELVLVSVVTDPATGPVAGSGPPRDLVRVFLDSTSEVPDGADLEPELVVA
jgi:hypothetical protein